MQTIQNYKSIYRCLFIIYFLVTKFHLFHFNLHWLDNLYVITLFTISAGILFLLEAYHKFQQKQKIATTVLLGFLFIFIYGLSTFIHLRRIPLVSMSYLFILLSMFFTNNALEEELKNICCITTTMISIPTIISIIIAVIEHYSHTIFFNYSSFFQETRLIGVIGFYQNPNQVGIAAFIGVMTALIVYFKFNKHFIFIGFAVANTILLLFSDSRSVLLAFIASCILFIMYLFKKQIINRKMIMISIVATIIGLLSFSAYRSTKSENRNIALQIHNLENSINTKKILNILTNQRYDLYSEAISIGLQSPLLGHGANTFVQKSIETYGKKSIASRFTSEDPHNIFVATFFYTGLIGLIIICIIFWNIFKNCVFIIKNSCELSYFLIIACITGIFIYSNLDLNVLFRTQFNAVIFWYLSGYIIALKHKIFNTIKEPIS